MPVSILILTLNEEINIGDCITSLSWSDDIIVLDSYSKDNTVEIAKKRGCRIVQRKFDNWSNHQNWAVKNIDFKYPWVLYFDADERCPEDLAKEIINVVRLKDPQYSAYRIRRKDYFMGKWLKHAQLYPTWIVRLFVPGRIRYERLVNPVAIIDGECKGLEGHIHHFPFSHGLSHWVERHNKYSDMEAEEMIRSLAKSQIKLADLTNRDPNIRRKALKRIFYRLPFRPVIKFIYYYFVRRGFQDGRPGLTYSALQAIYEYLIVCKYKELIRRTKSLPL